MAYNKQTWYDYPNETTPVNAERLNHMEQGIYEASTSGGSTIYSEEEIIIGKFGNADVYRKVIRGQITGMSPNPVSYVGDAIDNIDIVLKMEAVAVNTSGNITPLPWQYAASGTPHTCVYFDAVNTHKVASVNTNSNYQGASIIVIMEYTKTTN